MNSSSIFNILSYSFELIDFILSKFPSCSSFEIFLIRRLSPVLEKAPSRCEFVAIGFKECLIFCQSVFFIFDATSDVIFPIIFVPFL